MKKNKNNIALSDVLTALGQELRIASARGGRTISFVDAKVELEVAIKRRASGKLDFWVLEAGGEREYYETTRITVNVEAHSDFDQLDGVGR